MATFQLDKSRLDLQRELEDLGERLDEAGGVSQAQQDLNKKREAELAKMKRDLDAMAVNHETQLGVLRKKHNDAVCEMGEQLDQLQKSRLKLDNPISGGQCFTDFASFQDWRRTKLACCEK